MKCEICKTIERLGLDPSAHELWFCSERYSVPLKVPLAARIAHVTVRAASLHRIVADFLVEHLREAIGAGLHTLPAYREHYIKLGL
jgi:hypothetical protein